MSTWVKIHRKIEEWDWYKDSNTFRVFFHLILKANNADGKWRGHDVLRGQHITSPDKIADALGLSRQQVRTSLEKLKSTNEITIKSTNKFSLITIANYGLYQDKEKEITNKSPSKQQTNNQQITTNKNDKNDKENKNIYVADIISYLNEKTGKDFRSSTEKTVSCLNARWNEGFTNLQDYKTVIDNKCKEWLKPKNGEKDMSSYLRPETLFGNKFESYLNQSQRKIDEKQKETVVMVRREII